MHIRHNAKLALFLISIGMSVSCNNWKTDPIPVLRIAATTNATSPYACGLLRTSQQVADLMDAGVKCPDEVLTSNFAKTNWIYSTLPVHEVRYSRQMGLIFLVPVDDISSNVLHFIAIPRTQASGVKMTAVP